MRAMSLRSFWRLRLHSVVVGGVAASVIRLCQSPAASPKRGTSWSGVATSADVICDHGTNTSQPLKAADQPIHEGESHAVLIDRLHLADVDTQGRRVGCPG